MDGMNWPKKQGEMDDSTLSVRGEVGWVEKSGRQDMQERERDAVRQEKDAGVFVRRNEDCNRSKQNAPFPLGNGFWRRRRC